MRVLVTGATGAFGAPLCAALARRGVEVHAMARRQPATLAPGVRFVAGDVCDAAGVDAAIAGVDRVVHLAWLVGVSHDPTQGERINVEGTRNVLRAMRKHGTQKLVFSSSVIAYGSHPGHPPFREDDPLRPSETLQYGVHKRQIEGEIAESSVPSLVVRPAPVVGRSVTSQSAQIFATPFLVGVPGEVSPWQVIHQDDVMRFLVEGTLGERTGTVNLGGEDHVPLDRIGEILGRRVVRIPLWVLQAGLGALWHLRLSDIDPGALETLRAVPIADTTRLRESFGFHCAWSGVDALVDTRRVIAGINRLGSWEFRRGYAPALPPVGGRRPRGAVPPLGGAARPALDESFGARRETPLVGELASVAAASTAGLAPQPDLAASWARAECALLLRSFAEPADGAADARSAARTHQLWDAAIDHLALATGTVARSRAAAQLRETTSRLLVALAGQVEERGRRLAASGAIADAEAVWSLPSERVVDPFAAADSK